MASSDHDSTVDEIPHVELQNTNSSFSKRIREFDIVNFGFERIEEFLSNSFDLFEEQLVGALQRFNMVKTICYFNAEFERAFVTDEHSDPLFEKRLIYIPTKANEIDLSMQQQHQQSFSVSFGFFSQFLFF